MKAKNPDSCSHQYDYYGVIEPNILLFKCKFCRHEAQRKMTKKEYEIRIKYHNNLNPKRKDNIHYVWHDFQKVFFENSDSMDEEWNFLGWDLICRIEEWVKKFPDDVHLIDIDDSHYMCSSLLLIDHKTKDQYHGVTAISIPQNGQKPGRFFLYPGHQDDLIRTLLKIQKKRKIIQKREKKNEDTFAKLFKPKFAIQKSTRKKGSGQIRPNVRSKPAIRFHLFHYNACHAHRVC